MYAYDSDTVVRINDSRSTASLGDAAVYSDKLFLDFDNVSCADTVEMLVDRNIGFSVWQSGNRSFHIHINLEPMVGVEVPYSQRQWVTRNIPDHADLTFYHHAGQFRLPGTIHEKTGKSKVKIEVYNGSLVSIPLLAKPATQTRQMGSTENPGTFWQRLLKRQIEPGRRVHCWHLAKTALEESLSYEQAMRGILWWNDNRCVPPLEHKVVVDRVLQVYGKECK